jgi:hypothetical protein
VTDADADRGLPLRREDETEASEAAPIPPNDAADAELLRAWEARIESAGDPLGALADLLGHRESARRSLFQRTGDELLGCRLETILGAGGMGVTYAALTAAGEQVAVKLVASVDVANRDRFEQECRLLQEVTHPAIVRYRQHAVLADGTGVLVMDRVVGIDLERVLSDVLDDRGPVTQVGQALCQELPPGRGLRLASPRYRRRVLRMLAAVADGLHAAHERGIVHRDVKPANVLVQADLEPVVIDFGLARDQQLKVSFTASGAAMGTLAYMAPEQLGRDPGAIDRRTDVYALGLVLHRALLGEERRQDIGEVVQAGQRPFLLAARHSRMLPVELQAILYRCLDPRPAHRYPTAAQLAADLRAAAANEPIAARRPGWVARCWRDRRRVLLVALAAASVLLLALVVWWPRGRWVVLSTNLLPEECWIEVAGQRSRSGAAVWLPYGGHRVALVGSAVAERSQEIEVVPGVGAQRIGLLTQRVAVADPIFQREGAAPVHFTTGHSWTPMAPGVPADQRFIDGVAIADPAPILREAVLSPGLHHFRAIDGRGRVEEQSLMLGNEPNDVQLLPAVLSDVDGEFRCTWSTVMTPLPPALSVQSTAERWLGDAETIVIGGAGTVSAPCAFVPGEVGHDAAVVLVCRFPRPMKSAVVALRGQAEVGSELEVLAGFEGAAAVPWPRDANGLLQSRRDFRSPTGATSFVVRARLRAASQLTNRFAPVRFLAGKVFGGHWRDEPPCFAIAADPADAAVIRPSVLRPLPQSAPRVSVGRFLTVPLRRELGSCAVDTESAGCSLAFLARADRLSIAEVLRYSWPDFLPIGSLPASVLHRRQGVDGTGFGDHIVFLPDDDGDGRSELCIGDMSSQFRGAVFGGIVGRIDTRDLRARWTWAPRSTSDYGDDNVGAPFLVGDWNADGYPDVIAQAIHAWSAGLRKCGRIAVLDGRSGEEIWTLWGSRVFGFLSIVDTWIRDGQGEHAECLLREWNRDDTDQALGMWLSTWAGGLQGKRSRELVFPSQTAAVLVGRAEGAPALLVLRAGPAADGFLGLERFDRSGETWELRRQQPLAIDPPATDWLAYASAVRTGDLDGDGAEDAAFVLRQAGTAGVLFVSGGTLRLLGWCDLAAFGLEMHALPSWIPPVGGAPGQVLVVATRGDEVGFVAIAPGR